VAGLIAQVRELSTSLHPSMLDDLGLLPALNAHFERFQGQTGIQTRFQHENLDRRFSPEVEISAFRLIQEALTNVARYAAVKQVEVNISANENCLQIQVMDHGRGFDVEMLRDSERSFGLSGIRERTYLVGGTFDIVSRPNEGTRITATFPTGDRLERRKYDRANSVSR
jgi:signal transduction histidine kinase